MMRIRHAAGNRRLRATQLSRGMQPLGRDRAPVRPLLIGVAMLMRRRAFLLRSAALNPAACETIGCGAPTRPAIPRPCRLGSGCCRHPTVIYLQRTGQSCRDDRSRLQPRSSPATTALDRKASRPVMDDIARQLVEPVCNSQLVILDELHHGGHGLAAIPRQLECSLIRADTHLSASGPRFPIAAVDLTADLGHFWPTPTLFPMPHETHGEMFGAAPQGEFAMRNSLPGSASGSSARGSAPALLPEQRVTRPSKRRKAVHQQPATPLAPAYDGCRIVRRRDRVDSPAIPRPKGTSDNPVRQPSTPEKYISGVWQSLYAGQRTDITEVVEECQAVKSDVEQEVASENGMDVCRFTRPSRWRSILVRLARTVGGEESPRMTLPP